MRHDLTLHTPKFQFHLADAGRGWHAGMPELWTEARVIDRIAAQDGLVAVGTVRDENVPVQVEILPEAPPHELKQRAFNAADHVTTCHLSVQSGQIVLSVPGGNDALTLAVPPAIYRIVVHYNGLHPPTRHTADGTDSYHVLIYPHTWMIAPRVLKRWQGTALTEKSTP